MAGDSRVDADLWYHVCHVKWSPYTPVFRRMVTPDAGEISTEQTFVITATHVHETLWELAETLQAMQVDAWGIRGFDLCISDRPLAALNPMRVHIRARLHALGGLLVV